MKKLLLSLGLLLFLSFSLIGCNDNDANAQVEEETKQDFLADIISGEITTNEEAKGFTLELEVSPNVIFIDELPAKGSGVISARLFFDALDIVLPINGILTFRAEDGSSNAYTIEMLSSDYNNFTDKAIISISQLDQTPESIQDSIELKDLSELETVFGQAFLYIDSFSLCPDGLTLTYENPGVCINALANSIFNDSSCVDDSDCEEKFGDDSQCLNQCYGTDGEPTGQVCGANCEPLSGGNMNFGLCLDGMCAGLGMSCMDDNDCNNDPCVCASGSVCQNPAEPICTFVL